MIAASLGAAAAAGLNPGSMVAQAAPAAAGPSTALLAALKSGIPPNDGLAHPIPYTPPLGTGKDRALALGGGAIYLVSFYSGYLTSLAANGVDLRLADIVVGTSAGTVGNYAILMDQLDRMKAEVERLGKSPATMNYPLASPPFSVERADFVGNSLPTASVANIQALGRAAMAAHTPPVAAWQNLLGRVCGAGKAWPSPKFHTTSIDCYTAQRLVVSAKDDIPAIDAMSASSSWPGLAGPTRLKDRTAMDGGTCESSTHSDVVAGAKRVLIVSLASGNDRRDEEQGLRLSHFPNSLLQEVKHLEAGGSNVMLQVVGCPPGYAKISLVDPTLIPVAIKYGVARGASDAPKIKEFWR
ncbi:MAG: patatin-like phospholipase family protein [Candidatus Tumulicola sp.]